MYMFNYYKSDELIYPRESASLNLLSLSVLKKYEEKKPSTLFKNIVS